MGFIGSPKIAIWMRRMRMQPLFSVAVEDGRHLRICRMIGTSVWLSRRCQSESTAKHLDKRTFGDSFICGRWTFSCSPMQWSSDSLQICMVFQQ